MTREEVIAELAVAESHVMYDTEKYTPGTKLFIKNYNCQLWSGPVVLGDVAVIVIRELTAEEYARKLPTKILEQAVNPDYTTWGKCYRYYEVKLD